MRTIGLIALLLAVACESADAKLRRLQTEAALADLNAIAMHHAGPWPAGLTPEQTRAKLDSIDAADRAAALAHRALNKFLAGQQ